MIIEDINNDESWQLVELSQDVQAIREDLTKEEKEEAEGCDSFFVKIDAGEYTEILGFAGCVAYLSKTLYRIRPLASATDIEKRKVHIAFQCRQE